MNRDHKDPHQEGSAQPKKSAHQEERAQQRPSRPERNGLPAADIARSALEQLQALTGHTTEMVSGLERTEDGWKLSIEVLELERVPQSMSLLATYEMEVDRQGELMRYRRRRRYARGQAD